MSRSVEGHSHMSQYGGRKFLFGQGMDAYYDVNFWWSFVNLFVLL